MIYLKLFFSFIQVGLFSIGGGYAAMPLIRSQIVEQRGWLTMAEFMNLITIAEMTPGPITVNAATFTGIRIAGIGGAIAATLGCIFPSLILVSMLAFLYYRCQKFSIIQNILASLRPAVIALISSAGLSIARTTLLTDKEFSSVSLRLPDAAVFVTAFILLRKLKWNPILTMLLCGFSYLLLHLLVPVLP